MQLKLVFLALAATSVALNIPQKQPKEPLYIIQLSPDEIRTVTEEEKWALRREGKNFFDITDYAGFQVPKAGQLRTRAAVYPTSMTQTAAVRALLPGLSTTNMRSRLTTFAGFTNRYYTGNYGRQSSEWLLGQVRSIINASGASGVTVQAFNHSWAQSSIIARIPGRTANLIVLGAHQDSVAGSGANRATAPAPGADDDGSGCMTILEAFRVLLTDARIRSGQANNTIEIHFYAAEEAGLLGSQAIFNQYSREGRPVKAMLNQDMTGYVKPGTREVLGVVTDFVDSALTAYMKRVITSYNSIPFVETRCGYACSDHGSATRAGYQAAFVFESTFANSSPYIHTASDTINTINFNHMLEHAKMSVAFLYELAFHSF